MALDEILKVPVFRDRLEQLKKCIEDSPIQLVPWIGAGMSCTYGLPSWGSFMELLLQDLDSRYRETCQRLLDEGLFPLAADYLFERLGSHKYRDRIVDQFTKDNYSVQTAYPMNLIGVRQIVTTNYDSILERVFPWMVPITPRELSEPHFRQRRCLVKLHGTIPRQDTIVLSSTDYAKAYDSSVWKWLTDTFAEKTVFFLGCSLGTDAFLRILEQSHSNFGHKHYAIIGTHSDEESKHRSSELEQRYGIQVICYSKPEHGHGAVSEILKYLEPSPLAIQSHLATLTSIAEVRMCQGLLTNGSKGKDDPNRAMTFAKLGERANTIAQHDSVVAECFETAFNLAPHRDQIQQLAASMPRPKTSNC